MCVDLRDMSHRFAEGVPFRLGVGLPPLFGHEAGVAICVVVNRPARVFRRGWTGSVDLAFYQAGVSPRRVFGPVRSGYLDETVVGSTVALVRQVQYVFIRGYKGFLFKAGAKAQRTASSVCIAKPAPVVVAL